MNQLDRYCLLMERTLFEIQVYFEKLFLDEIFVSSKTRSSKFKSKYKCLYCMNFKIYSSQFIERRP